MIFLLAIGVILILVSTSGVTSPAVSVVNPVISPAVAPAVKVPEPVTITQPVTTYVNPQTAFKQPVSTFVPGPVYKPYVSPFAVTQKIISVE